MTNLLSRFPSLRNPNLTVSFAQTPIENSVQKRFADKWWTGLAPAKCPGFDSADQCLRALPLLNLDLANRQDVLDYFDNTWTLTELLFAGLKTDEAFVRPPYHQLRHPLIFYYGHPAVLFINKMRLSGLFHQSLDLYLEKVLETGVDEMSWDDMAKNEMNWPSVEAVHGYRAQVYTLVRNFILETPLLSSQNLSGRKLNSPLWALWMGFEHEKIHFETSSVLIRELPIDIVETPKFWAPLHPSAQEVSSETPKASEDHTSLKWQEIAATEVEVGKPQDVPSFGWDNEYGKRKIHLKSFFASKTQVTNGQYYEFVRSGGYTQDEYWSEEGLQWRKFRNTKRPTFWMAQGPEGLHEYRLRTVFSVINMPWNWPVEVNFHEAKAYCTWIEKSEKPEKRGLKIRLLTEGEHLALRKCIGLNQDSVLQSHHYREIPEMSSRSNREGANFNFHFSSPSPVNGYPMGNVWHWLEDEFNPLEGFAVHKLYDDFSTPCFDGRHQMILGGSFMSCGHEASQWARFHFRPHFYQHSGFRMAATLDGSSDNGAVKLKRETRYIHTVRPNVLDQVEKDSDWFKSVDQPLELKVQELEQIFDLTKTSILKFLNEMGTVPPGGTAHDPTRNSVKEAFRVPYQTSKFFPRDPTSLEKIYELLFKELAPLSQFPGHPGYMAYVAGAGNPLSGVAQWIAQTLNPFSGHYMMAPGLVTLEAEAIKWFVNLFGFDEVKALGYFTTGGSLANLNALAIARKEKLKGYDTSLARIYASEQVHHCVGKALSILGFPRESLVLIPTKNFKMDPALLKSQILKDLSSGLTPLVIVATVGTTNTGSVDPLSEIVKIGKEFDLWLHADGAYGALFSLCKNVSDVQHSEKQLATLENLHHLRDFDSLVFDPHKAFSIPYGLGGLIVKDKTHLLFEYQGNSTYMPPKPELDPEGLRIDYADISPELSRDYRGLRIWLPLKVMGIGPFVLNLEEKLRLTDWLADKISKNSKLELAHKPELTVVGFRVQGAKDHSDSKTKKLLEMINSSPDFFVSSCILEGKLTIRLCLLGYRLHFKKLEKFVEALGVWVDEV